MENINYHHELDEDSDDSLSLCDLQLDQETEITTCLDQDHDQELHHCLSNQDLFEFSATAKPKTDAVLMNNVIFCGRILSCNIEKPTNVLYDEGNSMLLSGSHRSNSFDMYRSKASLIPRETRSFRSEPGESKKHKFMIGVVRIPAEMELSNIRKRQSRQAPVSMFPADMPRAEILVSASNSCGEKGHQGLLRTWKRRSYLVRGLTKAYLGCTITCMCT